MGLMRVGFEAMASSHEITLDSNDEARAQRALAAVIEDIRRIEAKYSRYRADSVTSRINQAAGGDPVGIDPETVALLRYADRCFALSGGRFDMTSGVLRRVWDFRRVPPVVPSEEAVDAARILVGWDRVEWDEHSVRLPQPGMEIDFGGIGKEYAADRAATLFAEHGETCGFINLGGDVRVIGPRRSGEAWRIGIREPRPPADDADAALAYVELTEGAVATSGDYERQFEIDGRRYCHLIDARTGWPVDAWRSISVVAPLCVVAGSCSTIAMLLQRQAPAFLDSQRVSWLGVDADGARLGTLAPTSAASQT